MSVERTKIASRSGGVLVLVLASAMVTSVAAQDRRAAYTTAADDRGWYAALGAGVSRLSPDPGGSSLELTDRNSAAFGAWIGRDLSSRFSLEGSVVRLGEATLTGDQTIEYDAISLGVLGYILGDPRGIARREALSLYARAGLSHVRNESDLALESADDTSLWAAIGVDWPFARRFGLRAEVASYDGDAQAAFLTVVARPRAMRAPMRTPRNGGPASTHVPNRAQSPTPTPTPIPTTGPGSEAAGPPRTIPAPVVRPGGVALPSSCPAADAGEPVTDAGCARFAGVLRGVDFVGGSARLTPIGGQLLDRLAVELNDYPDAIVEIQAHVAAGNSLERARALSRDRAVATARRLTAAGVDVSRLRARAFGDDSPRADNGTAGGRRLNNRIEIDVVR